MSRVTGQQAKEWLEQTDEYEGWDDLEMIADYVDAQEVLRDNAEDLALTVAWLYGREKDWPTFWDPSGFTIMTGSNGTVSVYDGEYEVRYTPDDAEDLARCLLASAAEARLRSNDV